MNETIHVRKDTNESIYLKDLYCLSNPRIEVQLKYIDLTPSWWGMTNIFYPECNFLPKRLIKFALDFEFRHNGMNRYQHLPIVDLGYDVPSYWTPLQLVYQRSIYFAVRQIVHRNDLIR
jgi:hypothetical protein